MKTAKESFPERLDEKQFQKLASEVFRTIGDALEHVDSDVVDYEAAGDVMTLTMRRAKKCIVNTQRATRQMWMAASARAWHFSWNPSAGKWFDDRGQGDELLATIAHVVREASGVELFFPCL
jgi:CyaY protein